MLNFITWDVNPIALPLGSLEIRWYGLLWAIGIMLAYLIQIKLYKNEHAPADWPDKIFTYMVLGVIIGARLGHCWFYEWHEATTLGLEPITFLGMTFNYRNPYIENPFALLKTWEGGLSSHGGAFGLITASIILDKKHFHTGISWIFDKLVIGVCITATCIRFGNLMNSEIYGTPTDLPWGFVFVRNGDTIPCHPTQIYEMIYCIVAFIVTWFMYWKGEAWRRKGLIFGVFLEIIFFTRFCLEFIKFNQEAFEDSMLLNMGQWLSLPFIIWGVYLIVHTLRTPKDTIYIAEPIEKPMNHQERKKAKEKKK